MKRGTIVLTEFPFTDLQAVKRRPAVVVSKENNLSADVIVAFISSVIPITPSDTDFILQANHKEFKKSGLKKTSIIKLDKLATLNKAIFTGEIGFLSADNMKEIDRRLRIALDLK